MRKEILECLPALLISAKYNFSCFFTEKFLIFIPLFTFYLEFVPVVDVLEHSFFDCAAQTLLVRYACLAKVKQQRLQRLSGEMPFLCLNGNR